MSGSWELMQQPPSILVGILHTDLTTIAWAFGLRNLQIPGPIMPVAGMPYDMARNCIAMKAIELGCDFVGYLDSVPDYTPILIKRKGLVECIPICDLAAFSGADKEYINIEDQDIKVFVGERKGTWTTIRHVLRHPFEGNLHRINTHSGLVDVSANHSVIRAGGRLESVAGSDVRVGMKLSSPYDRGRFGKEKKFFFGSPELAWFYGLFAAEGSASGKNGVHIDNNNTDYLRRCQDIMSSYFGKNLKIHLSSDNGRDTPTMRIATSGRRLYEFFREKFYNSLGEKKVPVEILNAPETIKRHFLQGYYDGDGHRSGDGGKWTLFSTNSHTLALGIQWLLQTATQQTYVAYTRMDKQNIVTISVNQEKSKAKQVSKQRRYRGEVKKVYTIPYKGFLYDLETDKHIFAGGVGPILLHNSDVIPPRDAFLRLMSHRLPIVSGVYHRRSPPHGVPVIIKDGTWYVNHPKNRLFEADLVGAGCLVIHRSVLEKMLPSSPGHHWFDWRVDQQNLYPPGEALSEDFTFCRNARASMGLKIMVDPLVQCKHVGLASATYNSFLPCEVATVT